jgi:translation elongation factor aEF-1 beta
VEKKILLDVKGAELELFHIFVPVVVLKDLIKMADVVVTIKVMPKNPDVDLGSLEGKVKEKIKEFTKEDSQTKTEIEPVAFGLKVLKITFVMDESLGSPDSLAESVSEFEDVASADIIDVRRALG